MAEIHSPSGTNVKNTIRKMITNSAISVTAKISAPGIFVFSFFGFGDGSNTDRSAARATASVFPDFADDDTRPFGLDDAHMLALFDELGLRGDVQAHAVKIDDADGAKRR